MRETTDCEAEAERRNKIETALRNLPIRPEMQQVVQTFADALTQMVDRLGTGGIVPRHFRPASTETIYSELTELHTRADVLVEKKRRGAIKRAKEQFVKSLTNLSGDTLEELQKVFFSARVLRMWLLDKLEHEEVPCDEIRALAECAKTAVVRHPQGTAAGRAVNSHARALARVAAAAHWRLTGTLPPIACNGEKTQPYKRYNDLVAAIFEAHGFPTEIRSEHYAAMGAAAIRGKLR